jgi:phage terminase small subunit
MRTHGRISAEERVVVSLQDYRPDAPAELTAEQADEWRAIVKRMPGNWFTRETHPLLVQYCRTITRLRQLAFQLGNAFGRVALQFSRRFTPSPGKLSASSALRSSKLSIARSITRRWPLASRLALAGQPLSSTWVTAPPSAMHRAISSSPDKCSQSLAKLSSLRTSDESASRAAASLKAQIRNVIADLILDPFAVLRHAHVKLRRALRQRAMVAQPG